VDIAAAIKKAIEVRAEKIQIDAEWVLRQAVALYDHCVHEPVLKEGVHVTDKDGNPLYRVNVAGALRTLELIGKHVGVQAWQTKAVVDVKQDYSDLTTDEINAKIAERLERAAQKPVVGTKH
jgi:phage terminase small subunit